MQCKKWRVEIDIDERDGFTHAEARLGAMDTDRLCGVGRARLNPMDPDVPEIGDELAAARALADLSHQLMQTARRDVKASGYHRTRLRL
jgi:hypothetical protein